MGAPGSRLNSTFGISFSTTFTRSALTRNKRLLNRTDEIPPSLGFAEPSPEQSRSNRPRGTRNEKEPENENTIHT